MRTAVLVWGALTLTVLFDLRFSSAQTTVQIGFEQAAYTVIEGDNVTVCATVMNGTLSRIISVNVDVLPGTASGLGSDSPDYTLQGETGTIFYTFSPNVSQQCTTIQTLEDNISEPPETLSLSMVVLLDDDLELIDLSPAATNVTIIPCIAGEVRLVGGQNEVEGRVEICSNRVWGTVCDRFWDSRDASVVCRQLGFSPVGARALRSGQVFGQGTGPIHLQDVSCNGSESRLANCAQIQRVGSCSHFRDAGVVCSGPCSEGDIRTIRFRTSLSLSVAGHIAQLEVCVNGTFVRVCNPFWDNTEASVSCQQLGFSPYGALAFNNYSDVFRFGAIPNGPINALAIDCAGSETSLQSCPINTSTSFQCDSRTDVGVVCQVNDTSPSNCTDGEIQLVEIDSDDGQGGDTVRGRVEICFGRVWGTVCDNNWDFSDAAVVCRQLGFSPLSAQPFPNARFGQGTGPILLADPSCTGVESHLANCSNRVSSIASCSHIQDVGVACRMNCPEGMFLCPTENTCIAGDLRCNGIPDCASGADEQSCEVCTGGVRLTGGIMDGQVDVCVDGTYSSVCTSGGWSVKEASVVCRQLGLPTGGIPLSFQLLAGVGVPTNIAVSSSQPIEVNCTGSEENIQQCQLVKFLQCSTGTIAGVNCTAPQGCVDGELRLVGGPSEREGRVEMCYGEVWGSICDTQWNSLDAAVTCSQLGFEPSGAFPISPAIYGGSPAPVLFESPNCAFSSVIGQLPERLIDCNFTNVIGSPPVNRQIITRLVGVRCDNFQRTNCRQGDVRLTYRLTNSIGQVEVCVRNTWGIVCDRNWGVQEADVVCRQLGFGNFGRQGPTNLNLNLIQIYFGSRSLPIVPVNQSVVPVQLSNLMCEGTEQNLLDCNTTEVRIIAKRQINQQMCRADTAVTCIAPPRIILEPPSNNGVYTVEEGANFVLTCEVDIYSYPQPPRASQLSVFRVNASGITPIERGVRQQFRLNEVFLGEGEEQFLERRSVSGYIVLSTANIRREDAGEYRCVVNNTAGQQTEVNITINVQATEFVSSAAIRLSIPSLERFGSVVTAEQAIVATNNLVMNIINNTPGTQTANCSFITRQQIDQRRLERIECIITNYLSTVDVFAVAQRAAAIITTTNPTYTLDIVSATGFCDAETTEFLSWPDTPAGTTQSLRCPSTTTVIRRTCSSSGVWERVDPSLCTPFTTINVDDITLDNYEEILANLSGAVRGAAINEQEQTTSNLAIVTAVFARSAALVNEMTIIPSTTVQDLVNILEGLQQWNEDVLQTSSSNIVRSFEVIVAIFAQQLEDGERFSFMTETILFVAELLSQTELTENGRSFSSSGQTGNTNFNTLNENETAAAFLPPSLFQSITDRNSTGIFFAVYDTGVFFPIRNATELDERTNTPVTAVVGSPVLAATVGPGLNFSGLVDPVMISLRLNDLGNFTREAPRCVSWDFDSQEWTTEGCETDLAEVDGGVVTCRCTHLTNFAILVDICSRIQESCRPSGAVQTALEVVSIVGAVLSLAGIAVTIFTLLVFKKLRERDATIFHIQLCIALFCMMIVFVCGIDRTSVYGGCVLVSVQIHYFTLAAVMFMGAEAVLMFKKLIIVFGQTTAKFFVTISLICWLVPIIPVVIPLAVDLSDVVSENDLVIQRPTDENNGQGFCFISDTAVFFGAFLGPIFAILIFNVVIFVMVISVLIKHTRKTLSRTNEQMTKKTAIRLLISIAGVMSLFGLTWLFGALTVTGFGSAAASVAFQVLFVILNAFQGFFIFLFFCVFSKDARESWLQLLSHGRYHSKPPQAKYSSSGNDGTGNKVKTSSTGLAGSNLTSAISSKRYNSNTDDLSKEERYTDIPLTSAAEQDKEKPSVVTFKEIHETNVGTNEKVDLESSEVKEKEQELEKNNNSEERASPYEWREDGVELKARVKRFSTKKAYKHHVESAEVDFFDSDSDGNDDTNT